ncbi:F0F1 ATP synthase subunit delta [Paenibacillus woosongensis]|uniref:ATP synthase subunit delta n=1 Tax=Paenibacillus woosongensis TaxID=307580 RepID=A0ABQ4MW49_9BACL|nr:F0F1 ATP synthase subunit delta [Paenibacillus woosongensis]GIP60158.1 ATP synthase subunit delta [Paenibacillus woosongensis]
MSREAVVAGRYAKALYEIAAQEGRTLEVEQEIRALVNAFNEDQDIQKFISTPNISEAAKWEALEGALEGKMSKSVVSLVKLLVERGRIGILPELLDRYIKITGEALGLATATVYTTYPLNEEEKAAIADEFGALVNKKIRVLNEIDKDLLGGMKVRIGDTLYDGSLAGKLERLEKSFRRQAL